MRTPRARPGTGIVATGSSVAPSSRGRSCERSFDTTIHCGAWSADVVRGACAPAAPLHRSSAARHRAARDVVRFMRVNGRKRRAPRRPPSRSLERMMRLGTGVRRRTSWRGGVAAALMLAASVIVSATRAGAQVTPSPFRVLRVCSDPNNLPYSNEKQEGFENRIAELVARELNAELRYTWWAQRRGYIRNTIRAGLCDVYIGMPTGLDMLLLTRPYYRSTYAFVTRRAGPHIASFDDPRLKRLRVGVQIIGDDYANAPPADALAHRGIVKNVRGYS